MPGFLEILENIVNIYKNNKEQVISVSSSAQSALNSLFYSNSFDDYTLDDINLFKNKINNNFDKINGGLLGSPKFPMVPLLRSLLATCGHDSKDNLISVKHIKNTVISICLGGIYDHIVGGFSRYSTDEYWLGSTF